MELQHFRAAADFYDRAVDFLCRHEAHHNLILGICNDLMRHPERGEQPPYLAAVTDGAGMVGAAVMTPPHKLVLSRAAAPDALSLVADDVHREYATLPGVLGPGRESRSFAEVWQRVSGQPYRRGMAQRIYQLEAVIPASGVPGTLRRATEDDRDVLIAWLEAFGTEAFGSSDVSDAERIIAARLASEYGALYFWDDGRPVSLAGYGGPTPNGIRVGPVYTPPEYRGRGYASACVAAMSQLLLDSGYRYCFLFTDLGNPTSNHIYQAIGYQAVCDVDDYEFLAPDLG